MPGTYIRSVAALNSPDYSAPPTVLLLNGDVPAAFLIHTIAAFIAPSIAPSVLISAFCRSTLAPPLTALTFFLLGITNAKLRATVGTDAKLKLGLRD
jgi:hypothetical protein